MQARRVRRLAARDERRADDVWSRGELQLEPAALVNHVAGLRHVDEVGFEIGIAAHPEGVDARAVHRVLDLVRVLEAAHHAEVRPEHLHSELILGVERQRHLREDAADRADRLAFDVGVLRRVLADVKRLGGGAEVGIADRHRADLVRGLHEPLEQHRRHPENVADVVKPVRGVVGRQQRRRIDIEREEIAHRIRVFGAVETMENRTAGVGRFGGRAIQCGREPRDQLGAGRRIGLRRGRRRHHPDTHLLDRLFPNTGVSRELTIVHLVERESTGLAASVMAADAVLADDGGAACGRGRLGILLRSEAPERWQGQSTMPLMPPTV